MPAIEIAVASDSVGVVVSFWCSICGVCNRRWPSQTDYATQQRNRCRRAMNRLASAQVTNRQWVFFLRPR
jgi:hypothetical protein